MGVPMTTCVVGATGLVGRHVVEALVREGREQIVATFRQRLPFDAANTRWVKCDLREQADSAAAVEGAETVIVCAGKLSTSAVLRRDPVTSVTETLRIVTNVLEAAALARVRRVILISSCTGYPEMTRPAIEPDMRLGDPPSRWFGVGWMHRYLEHQLRWYVEHLGLIESGVILRPTLIYGPYDDFSPDSGHFIPSLIHKVVERTRPLEIWGDGSQSRNLLHAADLAEAILAIRARGGSDASISDRYRAFNVASPTNATVNEVLRHLVELDGFADPAFEYRHDLGGGPLGLSVSGQVLMEATGWSAKTDLRRGLADTLAWYRNQAA